MNKEEWAKCLGSIKSLTLLEGGFYTECDSTSSLLTNTMKVDFEKIMSPRELQAIAYTLERATKCIEVGEIEGLRNIAQVDQIIGGNQSSSNQEAAKGLIRIALQENMQGYDYNEGLPTNRKALKEIVLNNNHNRYNNVSYIRYYYNANGKIESKYDFITFGYRNEMEKAFKEFEKAQVIKRVDPVIKNIME
ncbi:hypothetical protein [Cellulosilyticum ruminicola]|uniref:hypothetical protein n=1 Tax=Cellulosilyticum ruminicola TaxID=425254 RepID=UPI0006CFDF7B|nr:hypothetical protein [Cellulosilyticum ruminicola]